MPSYFNPRTPCGVRRDSAVDWILMLYFNPRTPCGVRRVLAAMRAFLGLFQSTHPLRGATAIPAPHPRACAISIHAPLAGCDPGWPRRRACARDFNPRTPCGVRRGRNLPGMPRAYFNPRTPCGVRQKFTVLWRNSKYFNPRTPCGVRQQKRTKKTALFLN